ncbi:hypothetical protein J0X19_07680 [Hymenobacter sp. BT186]|uniref:Outer membrane protein beta-barrel domain-containing protein n=1 Tax=Hymenobacter telluris TaxID=2816474 RepID=A0A939JCZ8_9BACT|nr:outer membrane beta-barrel protein [Hymenobacter telluris]MBO0357822.1 hypothetical protein [Hymenobacter telluris]MBW3373849.1 hypothetical protein [Hymenobacter norwichensis]
MSTPLLSCAQSTPVSANPAPAHRFYVGVGAYTSKHEYWGSRDGLPSTHPIQVTIGYQLQPRLALQVSGVTAATKGASSGVVPQPNGTVLPYSQTYGNRSTSISLLGRYTLTRTPSHRLQVDGLGGFTLHHYSFDGTGSYPANFPGGDYDLHSRDTDLLLTIGASVRYRLSSRLEAVADGTVSTSLRALRDLTPAGTVGLRYNFGLR